MRLACIALVLLGACGDAVDEADVVDLGTIDITTANGSQQVGSATFTVPDDTVGASLVVQLEDDDADLVTVTGLARGGKSLGPLRVDAVEALCTAPYPASAEVDFGPGEHTISVASNRPHTGARLTGIFKRGASTDGGALDVNVHLAGLDVSADAAPSDPAIGAMLGEYRRLLAKAGIELGDVTFDDVSDASLADVEGPSSAPGTDLARLFALSDGTPGRALQLFVVRRLSQSGGMPLLGIAGSVPGPGEIAGTVHSGVVVSGEELPAGGTDPGSGPRLVGQVAAHETLHYLGLNHTTEREFDCGAEPDHDIIRDTPECTAAQDGNANCQLSTSECAGRDAANLMFWAGVDYAHLPAGTDAAVTAGQKFVVVRNPLVR
jgi:hypothetical protein